MNRRHIAAQLPVLLLLQACSLSHEVGDREDSGLIHSIWYDASLPADAGYDAGWHSIPAYDAGAPLADAGSSSACAVAPDRVDVTIEPVGGIPPATCMVSHRDDITLLGVDAEPAVNGVRIHANFCPGDDAECPCDIVVAHVRTDLAGVLAPEEHIGLDVRTGFNPFVALTHRPTCECDGCPCSLSFLFYAADADPDLAPTVPADVAFSTTGPGVCPAHGVCDSAVWMLTVANRATSETVTVAEGTTTDLSGVMFRNLRNTSVFAPCAACATCGSREGSWVAWVPAVRGI